MSDDQFSQLYKLMQTGLDDVHTELANIKSRLGSLEANSATKDQVGAVYDLLSQNIAEHERQEQERAAMSRQLTRHGQQLEQLAGHAGVELRYE